jgi:hypothetical protein
MKFVKQGVRKSAMDSGPNPGPVNFPGLVVPDLVVSGLVVPALVVPVSVGVPI